MKYSVFIGLSLVLAAGTFVFFLRDHEHEKNPLVATFSIVGYDVETGDLGVAVQSKFPNVRPIVP